LRRHPIEAGCLHERNRSGRVRPADLTRADAVVMPQRSGTGALSRWRNQAGPGFRRSSMPCAMRKVTTTAHVRRIGYGPWRLKAPYSPEECLSGCLTGAYAAKLDSTARTYGQKRSRSADWIARHVRADLAFGAGCRRFGPGEHARVIVGTAGEVVRAPWSCCRRARDTPMASTAIRHRPDTPSDSCPPRALSTGQLPVLDGCCGHTKDRPHRR
jgi:hypothetical protein